MTKSAVFALVVFFGLVAGASGAHADICSAEHITTATSRANPASISKHQIRLKSGQSLASVLNEFEVSGSHAMSAFRALAPHIEASQLHAGQAVDICLRRRSEEPKKNELISLSLPLGKREVVTVAQSADERFTARTSLVPAHKKTIRKSGIIRTSLFAAAGSAGVPDAVIVSMIRVFAWDVDFQRDIRAGDRFEVLYDQYTNKAGDLIDTGAVQYAQLTLGKKNLLVYRFETRDGTVEYYTPDGNSVRKNLLRTPVDGARISSRYGMRRHPIKGYTAMHRGIDFAAPRGTPIYAAGDGKVDYVGRRGGYGKYIRIRHGSEYATAYAHLSRYRKGLRTGKHVKQGQVIGYVGSTGRSTGPHLHYEVLRKGRQLNPASIKTLPGRKLRGKDLAIFDQHVATLDRLLASLPHSSKMSDS